MGTEEYVPFPCPYSPVQARTPAIHERARCFLKFIWPPFWALCSGTRITSESRGNLDGRLCHTQSNQGASQFIINTQRLITESKRFFGPILCLAAAYATFACLCFTTLLILTWHWGQTTPSRVSYISGVLVVATFGLAPAWFCGCFVWLGWQWFRAPALPTKK